MVVEIFDDQIGVLQKRQRPVQAQLDIVLALAQQRAIAAGDDRHQIGLAGGEIKHRLVVIQHRGIAEIGEAGGGLPGNRGALQTEAGRHVPGQPGAPIGQPAKIRKPIAAQAEIEGDIAQPCAKLLFPAGDRQRQIYPRRGIAALQAGHNSSRSTARLHGGAGLIAPGKACLDGERSLPRRQPRGVADQREQAGEAVAVGLRVDIARRWHAGQHPIDSQRAIGGGAQQAAGVGAVVAVGDGIGVGAIECGRELPLAQGLVQRGPALQRVGAVEAGERTGQGTLQRERGGRGTNEIHAVQPDKAGGLRPAERGVHRQRARRAAVAQRLGPVGIGRIIAGIGHEGAIIGGIGITGQPRQAGGRLRHTARGLGERAGAIGLQREIEAVVLVDPQILQLGLLGVGPAAIGHAAFHFQRAAVVVILEDEVNHPLIGRIAIAQRHLLGQHLHLANRLGRIVAQFAERGDALAVDEDHRHGGTPAPARIGLGRDGGQQIGDRADAIGGDILRAEGGDRLLRGQHLPLDPRGPDDDLAALQHRSGLILGRFPGGGCGLRRRFRRCRFRILRHDHNGRGNRRRGLLGQRGHRQQRLAKRRPGQRRPRQARPRGQSEPPQTGHKARTTHHEELWLLAGIIGHEQGRGAARRGWQDGQA